MATVFESPEKLKQAVGQHLGYSDWLEIRQDRIDQFAEATDDHQWIHVDPERAAQGPFGACIAHGYLTLSLVNRFLPEIVEVRGISMGVNYGTNRLRFPAPVPVGSKLRGGAELIGAWFKVGRFKVGRSEGRRLLLPSCLVPCAQCLAVFPNEPISGAGPRWPQPTRGGVIPCTSQSEITKRTHLWIWRQPRNPLSPAKLRRSPSAGPSNGRAKRTHFRRGRDRDWAPLRRRRRPLRALC